MANTLPVVVCLSVFGFISGCASNQPPPAWAQEWAKQQIANQQAAEQTKQKQALEERDRAEQATQFRARCVEFSAKLESTKADYLKQETERQQPTRQDMLNKLGFVGNAVYLQALDVKVDADQGVEIEEIGLLWLAQDAASGGFIKAYWYVDLANPASSELRLGSNRPLTQSELADLFTMAGIKQPSQVAQGEATHQDDSGFYQRNQKTIDNAAIKVGEAALTAFVINLINSAAQSSQ